MNKRVLLLMFFVVILSSFVAAQTPCGSLDDDQTSCDARADCTFMTDTWGSWCQPVGCWNFQDNSSCSTANATINQSCVWNTPQNVYGWCQNRQCWNFDHTNQSACENSAFNLSCTWSDPFCNSGSSCNSYNTQPTCTNNTGVSGKPCAWDSTNSFCYERSCYEHDGDQSACEGETAFDCEWNSPYCNDVGCWSNQNETACVANNCDWHNDTNVGWCEQVQCWQFDNISMPGTANQTTCENNVYGINCVWEPSGGWCYENVTSSCTDFTNERSCLDSFFCSWNNTNSTCQNPTGSGIFTTTNPGCYVFDFNQTTCENLNICDWTGTTCTENSTIAAVGGVQCANVTDSSTCTEVTVLGSCCEWKAGTCQSTFSTSCWDQMDEPPEGAEYCEDYNSYNNEQLCNQIKGPPWYMPCEWNNVTELCKFRSDDVFNGTGKLIEIDNRRSCEAAGGQWITDSYCEGNTSVPVGRCEPKFDQQNNCNQACFACEKQPGGSVWSTSSDAQTACEESDRGCEFTVDSNAPNGWRCEAKDVFKSGVAGDCDDDCRGCTYLNNAQLSCDDSKANCKWDTSTSQCVKKGEQTCNDACDRCYSQNNCVNNGRGTANACKWENDFCQPATGSSEICWNGIDDDDDDAIDCADSNCYGDQDCGGDISGSNCFAYSTESTCNATSSCLWFTDSWGSFCEFAGALCWNNDGNQTACEANNASCEWYTFQSGGECEYDWNQGEICWQLGNNATACNANGNCTYINDSFGGGFCEFTLFSGGQDCFQYDNNETGCNAQAPDCSWFQDEFGGFCDPSGGSVCFANQSLQTNATLCNQQASCTYITGLCDPIGFGGHDFVESGFGGLSCFANDGNQTACENKTGCSWFSNPGGAFCDMDRSCQSPDFFNNQTMCENAGCIYQTQPFTECYPAPEACFRNQTLQLNQTICDSQAACNWSASTSSCEPSCFIQSTEGDCTGASGCIWMNGFCEDDKNVQSFVSMELGEPVVLGDDSPGDANSGYTDLLGLGMKEMGEYIGFGARVNDLVNASICNGQYIQSLSMQGAGTGQVKFYIYLDTDGSTTGTCTLQSDSSAAGYEFLLSYTANSSGTKVTESYTAYRCSSGSWIVSDITLSSFRALMCSEINGPMLAVEEADLLKFSSLYNPEEDMRIYVATADNETNTSNPSDTAGPNWFTLGAIDFSIEDMFSYGADSSTYEDILRQGYVGYENCYNSIDDDNDGLTDCNDFDCSFANVCSGLGVNAPGFVDTRMPQVVGIKIENYPDSALIMYDTNKPANGTLQFYYNSSSCDVVNTSIFDVGVISNNSREYKNWHSAHIDSNNLGYSLSESTSYYYKLKVCDDDGKCAASKCSNFTTSSSSSCKYCDFVTRINVPSNWYITYDLDRDMLSEHVQGQVCGVQAGMKTNYTTGKLANVYLFDNLDRDASNASGIIFQNVTLTKSALNAKVRSISNSNDIASGTSNSENYVGLPTSTRDKIINNLHPELCIGKFPKPSGGCTELWHCDDDLENCEERDDASLWNTTSTHCLWVLPFCEFSVWSSGNLQGSSSSSSSSSGGGGGGGGGGGAFLPVSTDNVLVQKSRIWSSVQPGQELTFYNTNEKLSITNIAFSLVRQAKKITLGMFALKGAPSEVKELENAYQYLELAPQQFTSFDVSGEIDIGFFVPTLWVEENGLEVSDVSLYRWVNSQWNLLDSRFTRNSPEKDLIFFTATSPGFSYFAVGSDKTEVLVEETQKVSEEITGNVVAEAPEPELKDGPRKEEVVEETTKEKTDGSNWFIWLGALALVLGVVFGLILRKKDNSDDE